MRARRPHRILDDSAVTISAGNRKYLKINTGITVIGVVAGLIWVGAIWQQARDIRDLANETARLSATKQELLEMAGALNTLASRQDTSSRMMERIDLLSQERWTTIESTLARIERDISQIKRDRVQYKWDRSFMFLDYPLSTTMDLQGGKK